MANISHNDIKEKAAQISDGSTAEPGRLYKNGDKYRVYNGRRHYDLGELQVFDMYEDNASFPTVGIQGKLYYTRVTGDVYTWIGIEYEKVGTTIVGSIRETGLLSYNPDVSQNNYFEYTITNDSDIGMPVDFKFGKSGTIVIVMDTIGGHTITFDSAYHFIGGPVTIDNTPNAVNTFKYTIQGLNSIIIEELHSFVPSDYFVMKFETDGNVEFTSTANFEFTSTGSNWNSNINKVWTPISGTYIVRSDVAMDSFKVTLNPTGLIGDVIIEGIGTTDTDLMFRGCTEITSVDMTRFRMNSVTDVDNMFKNCTSLTCISSMDTTGSNGGATIFNGCTSLIRPNAPEITTLEAAPGTSWTNPVSCP